jgi:hypothetical protein
MSDIEYISMSISADSSADFLAIHAVHRCSRVSVWVIGGLLLVLLLFAFVALGFAPRDRLIRIYDAGIERGPREGMYFLHKICEVSPFVNANCTTWLPPAVCGAAAHLDVPSVYSLL